MNKVKGNFRLITTRQTRTFHGTQQEAIAMAMAFEKETQISDGVDIEVIYDRANSRIYGWVNNGVFTKAD